MGHSLKPKEGVIFFAPRRCPTCDLVAGLGSCERCVREREKTIRTVRLCVASEKFLETARRENRFAFRWFLK